MLDSRMSGRLIVTELPETTAFGSVELTRQLNVATAIPRDAVALSV